MSIRPLLSNDLNGILRLIKNLKKSVGLNDFIKFSYILTFNESGIFETETLEIDNEFIIHPIESRRNRMNPILFKKFKSLDSPGSLMLDSEECTSLTPYLHDHLGLCDFKLSVNLSNSDLHEKEKPFQYKNLVGWQTDNGFDYSDISSDYTFLVKNFKVMKDYYDK